MAANHPSDQVIVVGGGLGGMSAANTLMEHGGKVVLLDKSAFCGGNSTKATSGINGAETKTQKQQGIKDTVEVFESDCLKGGAKKPELIKVLCENSGGDIDWLQDAFNLDLSLLARLGGHSFPRTHRGKERFPGMTITYALIQMVEKIAERSDIARIVTKAEVTSLVTKGESVIGVEYKKGGQTFKEFGSVILATGGFGADFQQDSLLAKYRPDLMHLPTTNGEHCTGDGIKISEAIGAKTIDLEWVQVHPTGLVNPKDQDAKVKFLAAEALRGVGGLVFDADGKRFANELGRRDYVTGEMWKNKGPFRLVLNKAASDEIIWHCKHYTGRGVMKYYESGKAFAQDINVPLKTLEAAHQAHYDAAKKQEADPEGGPWKAYPSGKSWDEASGVTGSGKKFFHNIIPGSQVANEPFYVAIITPVIHYCMGGLEITEKSEVLSKKTGRPIPGLYAAGEVMGGVHGNNRLGGNSLLDCVVFGRVSGRAAAEYQLGSRVKQMSLKDLSGGGLTGEVTSSKMAGGSYEDNMNKGEVAKGASGAGVAAPAAGGGAGGFTLDEVAKHTTNKDCWVVINGDVLNVTNFLPDHPGGELAIMTFAGKDASEEFNMIHPPDVISKYAPEAIVGRLVAPGAAGAAAAAPAAVGGGLTAPLLNKGEPIPNDHYWGEWREIAKDENPGVLILNPGAWVRSVCSMVVAFVLEILKTIFTVKNFKFTNDRTGLTRSAVFIVFFMVIHAVGNLHIFGGPDDFNGYGYFYVRLYWTGFGLEANIVEEYVALCAVLHVLVALRRVYDVSGNMNLMKNKATLAVTGVFLLAFMCIHLVQFRFGDTEPFLVRPPPYLINFGEILRLRLFWTADESVTPVPVRNIYKLEFDLFQSPYWIAYYMFNILMFLLHGHFGWQQLAKLPAFGIPKGHIGRVQNLGTAIFLFVAACYFSFPLYCHFCDMKPGVIPQSGGVALSPHHAVEVPAL